MHVIRFLRLLRPVVFLFLAWAGIQILYVGVTQLRFWQWNRQLERDAQGVAETAKAFAAGEGETCWLLVHGFGDSPDVWRPLANSLAEQGMRVRALRLEGWGEEPSGKNKAKAETWREQIKEAIREEGREGGDVWLAAHSMGGCVLANLLLDQELSTIMGAVLYAPMLGISPARSPLLTPRQWFGIGMRSLPMIGTIESIFPEDMRRNPPRPRIRRDPYVTKNIYGELFEQIDRAKRDNPSVSCPLMVVVPGEDQVVDSLQTQRWFGNLQAGKGKVWRVEEECGHTLPLDFDSDLEAKKLLAWMQQQ